MKLLFIYLFSNERASICGLYELPLRTISFETGMDREIISKGLEVFNKADKATYDFEAGVVWIKNMLKYQGSSSPKVQARIQADIKAVPDCALKQQCINTLSIPNRSSNDTSISFSSIDQSQSQSLEEGVQGEKPLPTTPSEAAKDPDILIFSEVTGRWPGVSQYPIVIDTLRFIRKKRNLTYEMAISYLTPFWLAWSGRKRQDGRLYDPSNLTWLTEWAVNGQIPLQGTLPANGNAFPSNAAEVIKQVASRRK